MKLTYDIIRKNIQTLERAFEVYPILKMYHDGDVTQSTMFSMPWQFNKLRKFIDFKKENGTLIFDEKVKYRDLRKTITSGYTTKGGDIFRRKSKKNFDRIFKDEKYFDRYMNKQNESFFNGFLDRPSLLFNYLIQNEVELAHDLGRCESLEFYTWEIDLEIIHVDQINNSIEMAERFKEFVLGEKLDINNTSVNILTSHLNHVLKQAFGIEKGSQLKAKIDFDDFKAGQIYQCGTSFIDYNGFLKVTLLVNGSYTKEYPFSYFEDVSRIRYEKLKNILK